MFIKYDKSELFEFFESEPADVTEEAAGDWVYVYKKDDFKIVLSLSTYGMYIDISISYCDNIVYTEMFREITEINKVDIDTIKIIKNDKRIIVKKGMQIGVIVEEN